jgi:nucleotide-binding universal stress UspA family protein
MPTRLATTSIQPRSILVATDLHDLEFLLPVAMEQAKATGAKVWLVHVVPPETPTGAGTLPEMQRIAFRRAEALLAKATLQLRNQLIRCDYEVRRWYPVDRIIEFVREHEIDRVILGTSGKGKLGKLLVGSVAEELIRKLDVPVCAVGPHCQPPTTNTFHRIVFATSLRHDFEKNLVLAAQLASASRGELIVLHVMEQDQGDESVDLRVVSKIDRMRKAAAELGLVPQLRIRHGEPAEEILAECSLVKADMLILGAVPASAMAATFRSGVAYRVIAHAPCPTFTVCNAARKKHAEAIRETWTITTNS